MFLTVPVSDLESSDWLGGHFERLSWILGAKDVFRGLRGDPELDRDIAESYGHIWWLDGCSKCLPAFHHIKTLLDRGDFSPHLPTNELGERHILLSASTK
jgi:hypothetical protein